ncbi:mechanosensitive ion channel family protein [Zhouia sp. PK063]|uniref:mechanosensitive ion channel family protein n=1 Tax=Zhouia sp. PK063 TaxID=3373602 RepID=UPI0037A4220A
MQLDVSKYQDIICWLENLLLDSGVSQNIAMYINLIVNIIILSILIFILDSILRKVVVNVFKAFSNKTKTTFDDFLVESNFPKYAAHVIPLYIVKALIPYILYEFIWLEGIMEDVFEVYVILLGVWIIRSFMRSTVNFLRTKESFHDKPLDSYFQVILITVWLIAVFGIITQITDTDPLKFFTALGAASAVLLLIFKDSILGFVASIQVAANDIVRIGDWITMEKFGADGDVMEINLATVKVRNFDNTITTIPTYSLISDSFKNWRGMQDSGGRRIKRSLNIKQNSVKFLTSKDVEELKKIQLIQPYLNIRQRDIEKFNNDNKIDKSLAINGRNQTNLGVFRKYIDAYLNQHSAVNKDLTMMTRHLQATPQGIPLEIYVFSGDKRWVNYEHIMADIFEHLIAAAPYFGLELYELPTGKDFITFKEKID